MSHDTDDRPTEFMGMTLSGDTLDTPVGQMPLAEITRAAFHRDMESAGRGPSEVSTGAVVGGAVVGGVLFGAAGAVVGGIAGSTVKQDGPEQYEASNARLIFTTPELRYELPLSKQQESEAIVFADAVYEASKRAKK